MRDWPGGTAREAAAARHDGRLRQARNVTKLRTGHLGVKRQIT
jgi:hypothetical protein